jgi:hypothetical protein
MRLWTIHPRYLDARGLVALWREGLLAQKVLAGKTRGYTRHPQLTRFREHTEPLHVIAVYLRGVADEAVRRGYQFDQTKIAPSQFVTQLEETRGQLLFEWEHLKQKLRKRRPEIYRQIRKLTSPDPHPLFRIVSGEMRDWERARRAPPRRSSQRTSTSIGRT